jgi:hypothetical protein
MESRMQFVTISEWFRHFTDWYNENKILMDIFRAVKIPKGIKGIVCATGTCHYHITLASKS